VHESLTGEESCPHTFYRAGGSAQRDRSPTGPGIFTGRTPVVLPEFAIADLTRRRAAVRENTNDAMFPTRNSTWPQANNVERRWRQIRTDTGLEWITPHTLRKTVATLISPRVEAETASQQLGHSSPAITRKFYISKPAIAADVAHVLAELAGADTEGDPNTSGMSGKAPWGANTEPALLQRFRWSERVRFVGLTGFEPATPCSHASAPRRLR
jgi:hypothetical protein